MYIISATVPPCTKLACGFLLQDHPTGIPYRNSPLEKWQSHCSEKVNEIDFSKGAPQSRNRKFAPRCSENAGFAENVRFLLPGEPRPRQKGVVPWGTLKSSKIRHFFECVSNGFGTLTELSKYSQGWPKEPKKMPKGHFRVSPGRLLKPKG